MSYCTLAELIETYGESDIRQLSDRVNRPPLAIDAMVVARAITDAAAEIDLHLEGRYGLPLASVPTALKRIAGTLAYANLHTRLSEDSPVLKAAEASRRLLSGIASGKLSLGLDATGAPAPSANVVQFIPSRRPSRFRD